MRSSRTIENSLLNLRGFFQFFGVLAVLMSLAALAQKKGAGPAYAKAHAVSALPGADNGGHVSGIHVQTVALVTHPNTPVQRVNVVESYGRVPLAFEANQGQTNPQVKFISRGPGYGLFLTTSEAVLTLRGASRREPSSPKAKASLQDERSAVLHMKLVGANATATQISGKDELSSKSNYFIGNDPKKWRTNVRQYARVCYANLYPGVDLVYYGNQRELEYDFVLHPGADPETIRLRIEGASKLRLASGDLVLGSPGGDVRLRRPFAYQEMNGTKKEIRSHYVMRGAREVGFRIGSYDRSQPLIIDPVLAYSTYLGGSADEAALDIAVDSAGNAYVTGFTTSIDFPTANPFQSTYGGGSSDVYVTKINATGSALVYSTYLGGSSDFDVGQSVAVDSVGSVYVTGATGSPDFPTVNPIQATNHGIRDAFVTKISPDGSALVYSTYLGGSGDDYGWGIAVDSAGNAHVTGDTPSRDFPVFKALQPRFHEGANFNTFVSEINADGSALIYSTYWGGSGGEGGSRVAVDLADNTYIGGYTFSPDFPTVNAIQPIYAGNVDAYLTKLTADGQTVIYSTFLGGSGFEYGWDVAVDSAGNAYMTGFTQSTDFPTAHALQPTNHGGFDAFVAKISGDGSSLLYSTYLGGTANESEFDAGYRDLGIAVDSAGSAYVAGTTKSVNFPTTPLAFQKALKGGSDAFVAKIASGGVSLTTLASSLNPSIYGQKVTWTATVTSSGSVTPTGTIKFTWSGHTIGSATLNSSGVATLTRSNLIAATYPLKAVYAGDAANLGSTSAVLNQVVLETTSKATLTSSPNPSTQGQAVTFTAKITSPTVIPTGPVTFIAGTTVLGTAQLGGGKAKLVISSLPVGSTKVTVKYNGDSNIAKSSASVTQTVQ